jgi:hypothetical protein
VQHHGGSSEGESENGEGEVVRCVACAAVQLCGCVAVWRVPCLPFSNARPSVTAYRAKPNSSTLIIPHQPPAPAHFSPLHSTPPRITTQPALNSPLLASNSSHAILSTLLHLDTVSRLAFVPFACLQPCPSPPSFFRPLASRSAQRRGLTASTPAFHAPRGWCSSRRGQRRPGGVSGF